MKKILISLALVLFIACIFAQFRIENALVTPGSGKLTISYDLYHPANLPCTISLEVSANGGTTYTIFPSALTGDVGEGIMPGTGKTIIWHPAADGMEIGSNYRIKITAEDGQPDKFVFVQGGSFHNGSGTVTLSSFYIGKHEVTQTDYLAVMGSNPSSFTGVENGPVERVTWFKAIEYCNRKSIADGLTPCYSYDSNGTNPDDWPAGWNTVAANQVNISCNWQVDGYRLPTEMEWMFAAKGGTQSNSYIYSGSNDQGSVAWYSGNAGSTTHTVGTKAPNELGLQDMSGNVREWCWDAHNFTYPTEPTQDPTGPAMTTTSSHVYRGGSWFNSDCSVTVRNSVSPTNQSFYQGFRIAYKSFEGRVSNPVFDPPPGSYSTDKLISISTSTSGAAIYYTLDGSEPTLSSNLFSEPISIGVNTTIKAKAFRSGWMASNTAVAEYVINILSPNFIYVQGSTFSRQNHDGFYPTPLVMISLTSFYMDKYELTQAGYQNVMGSNPSHFSGFPNRPVEMVSWYDAIEYCNRRSILEGFTPCYSYTSFGTNPDFWPTDWNSIDANHTNIACNWLANGYRLPTEMEWMYAAKGGNQSQNYTYSGSNTLADVGFYATNSDAHTWDVGQKAFNELGLHDLSGNVWEWCWDIWSSYYPIGNQTDPTGVASGSNRVSRGGAWYSNSGYCELYIRGDGPATSVYNGAGFRCVRSFR